MMERAAATRPAVHDLLAHARELVQARLDHIEHRDVGCDRAIVDRHDEGLELVGEIAHGGDAGHTRAALEGVQRALETVAKVRAVGL